MPPRVAPYTSQTRINKSVFGERKKGYNDFHVVQIKTNWLFKKFSIFILQTSKYIVGNGSLISSLHKHRRTTFLFLSSETKIAPDPILNARFIEVDKRELSPLCLPSENEFPALSRTITEAGSNPLIKRPEWKKNQTVKKSQTGTRMDAGSCISQIRGWNQSGTDVLTQQHFMTCNQQNEKQRKCLYSIE